MFHLMPYRDLPADFDQRYKSAFIDPVWFDVADSEKVGKYYNATLDELLLQRRPACTGCAPISITRTSTASWPIRASWGRCWRADQRPGRGDHPARLDAALDHAADAHRRGVRDARLHQRRAAGGGFPTGLPTDATPLQRRRPGRAARALPRGARPRVEGLVGEGALRLERQALPAGHVNLWPRPIQQPHPPIWIPAPASPRPPNTSSASTTASVI